MTTPAIGRTGLPRISSAIPAGLSVIGSRGIHAIFDDFLGDVIADQWNAVEGTDALTSDAAILAGGVGGVLRLTSGDAGTGFAADGEVVNQALQWRAANGNLCVEVRAKLSAIANCGFFFGFTDTLAFELPVESAASADLITTTATDAVGFMFDTRMTTDNVWLVGVKADVDAVKQDSLWAPVAAQYATFRIETTSDGRASFFINGVQVGTEMVNALTATVALTPVIVLNKTSVAASVTLDVDYIGAQMIRGVAGAAI